jgi:hypothetical protein
MLLVDFCGIVADKFNFVLQAPQILSSAKFLVPHFGQSMNFFSMAQYKLLKFI